MFGAVAGFLAVLLIVFFAAGRATGRFSRPLAIVIFLAPALILLVIGLVIPAVRTIVISFEHANDTVLHANNLHLVGGRNYAWVFTTGDNQHVLLNTVLWIVVAPVVTTAFGLLVALLVDRLKRQAVYKSLIFMPQAVSFVGASIVWRFVYESRGAGNAQIGLLSQIVIWLGWKNPPNWILSSPLNTFLLMVALVWVQTGFAMVVLSAAIKAIPDEIIEAAQIDGARGGKLFYLVTIPMIRNTLVVVFTTTMITTLKIFDIVRTMTGGNFGTQVLANEMYNQTFVSSDYGRGSALAVILFLGVLPLVGYNIMQLRRERSIR
ncbi:MAG: sugar ABC transporter permease [Micromonosporaceae bacterium]|nr:sugar ABC transporter permease [Micromonosporaceae bacterium]